MIACAAPEDDSGERGSRRGAPLPRLPCLKKDNCIVNGRYRAVFVAQENIRLYIWKFGEQNVGALTVTAADCLEAAEFQDRWHSFLNSLRKIFSPTGMWARERQPRSGNWHAHAVVNVGWDTKPTFREIKSSVSFIQTLIRSCGDCGNICEKDRRATVSVG